MLDCPWAALSREMLAGNGDPWNVLKEKAPKFAQQVEAEKGASSLKAIWGRSINFDENTKATIVPEEIIDDIFKHFQVPPREGRVVHAGAEHIYGYLFSNFKTPFGYKRARWVRADIENGFALERGTLGPAPSQGAFFSNVTSLLAKLALGKDLFSPLTARPVRALKTRGLVRFHIIESVSWDQVKVELHTDLIRFPIQPKDPNANSSLLIYSVVDSRNGNANGTKRRLITAFPVTQGFVDGIMKPELFGDNLPISTRYNAFVDGLTGAQPPKPGSRHH